MGQAEPRTGLKYFEEDKRRVGVAVLENNVVRRFRSVGLVGRIGQRQLRRLTTPLCAVSRSYRMSIFLSTHRLATRQNGAGSTGLTK